MNNDLKNCIGGLMEAVITENHHQAQKLVGDALTAIKSSPYKLHQPEKFNLFVGSKLSDILEVITKELHKETVCKDTYKPHFIYEQYSYLEQNIEKLCVKKESHSCSADKSRYILQMYLNYALTGEIPEDSLKKGEYWKPRFGTLEQWMNYCDGLYRLYFGNPDEYLFAYKRLLECAIEKFEYDVHYWFIETLDGDIVDLRTTYDEDVKPPVLVNDDCYILWNRTIGGKVLEKFVPEKEEDKYLLSHYKLPKADVKRVYKETKKEFL